MLKILLAAGLLAIAPLAAFADDRPRTNEERAQIEEVLRAEGFTSWDEIEWDDDGYWEIEYHRADGASTEVRIDPMTGQPMQ
jgi:hypothetical protein